MNAELELDNPSTAAEARIGMQLSGKWTLESVIGVGGMAAVYRARHRNRSRVAIKMLHQSLANQPAVTQRFLQEGYAGNSVEHPGVVKVLDDGVSEDGSAFIVMELLEGIALEDLIVKWGPLAPAHIVDVGLQVLSILIEAHAAGVVHRDIKPDNLFITLSGEVKLLDFGIAKVESSGHRTTVGSFMGTPAFSSPEQARGRWESVDARSDLWSLAATLFYALSGEVVHDGETPTELLALAVHSHARKVAEVSDASPEELASVIDRALSYDRDDRYASASEFFFALEGIEESLPLAPEMLGELAEEVSSRASLLSDPVTSSNAQTFKRSFESDTGAERTRRVMRRRRGGSDPQRRSDYERRSRAAFGSEVEEPGASTRTQLLATGSDVAESSPQRNRKWLLVGLGGVLLAGAMGALFALAFRDADPLTGGEAAGEAEASTLAAAPDDSASQLDAAPTPAQAENARELTEGSAVLKEGNGVEPSELPASDASAAKAARDDSSTAKSAGSTKSEAASSQGAASSGSAASSKGSATNTTQGKSAPAAASTKGASASGAESAAAPAEAAPPETQADDSGPDAAPPGNTAAPSAEEKSGDSILDRRH